ncbi:MAG: hypothetical protein WC445_04705 [Patescibacteria group bacterium]
MEIEKKEIENETPKDEKRGWLDKQQAKRKRKDRKRAQLKKRQARQLRRVMGK